MFPFAKIVLSLRPADGADLQRDLDVRVCGAVQPGGGLVGDSACCADWPPTEVSGIQIGE